MSEWNQNKQTKKLRQLLPIEVIGEQWASKNVPCLLTKYAFQLYSISPRDNIGCSESQLHVPHNGQLSKVQKKEIPRAHILIIDLTISFPKVLYK